MMVMRNRVVLQIGLGKCVEEVSLKQNSLTSQLCVLKIIRYCFDFLVKTSIAYFIGLIFLPEF